MVVIETLTPAVKLINTSGYDDECGFCMEAWNAHAFKNGGIPNGFVRDNHSWSVTATLSVQLVKTWPASPSLGFTMTLGKLCPGI